MTYIVAGGALNSAHSLTRGKTLTNPQIFPRLILLLQPKMEGHNPKKFFSAGPVPPTFEFVPAQLNIGMQT